MNTAKSSREHICTTFLCLLQMTVPPHWKGPQYSITFVNKEAPHHINVKTASYTDIADEHINFSWKVPHQCK